MHKVSANYALPALLRTLKPAAKNGAARAASAKDSTSATGATGTTGTAGTAGTSASSASGGNLGTTFLSLLSQELQNQDPTAPVDSTALVGQLISLNQLDQLISINQAVAGSSASTTTVGLSQPGAAGASVLDPANGVAGSLSPSVAGAAANQLPFDPNTLLPLPSANSGAVAATINSSLNAATVGLSGTKTNTSGDK